MTKAEAYKLLKKKHTETNWNSTRSIKEYNAYARKLLLEAK